MCQDKFMQDLIQAACEAEEKFSLDELEAYAAEQRSQLEQKGGALYLKKSTINKTAR